MRIVALWAAFLGAACTPVLGTATFVSPALIPYSSITPSLTASAPAGLVISERTPLPSPTPLQYTIRQGDTLSQIAERFRLTLDALMAANPQVNPSALRVGEALQIPASPADFAGGATPTAFPVLVREVACHPTADGAVWCFVLVSNDTRDSVENITAQLTLLDSSGTALQSKQAVMPLNALPPGASLPLSVLFPPPLPLEVSAHAQILTAIRLLPGDQRYVGAEIRGTAARLGWSGRTAEVAGELFVASSGSDAAAVWLVAVAYDRFGRVVGWRRWESPSGVAAGASRPFELTVSSVAGPIDRIEYVVEARP